MEPTKTSDEIDFPTAVTENFHIQNECTHLMEIENEDQEQTKTLFENFNAIQARQFNHINIENFVSFINEDKIKRISGMQQIIDHVKLDPLKSDINTFLTYLRQEFESIIMKSKEFSKNETQKIYTFVEKEFFILQTKRTIHEHFVISLNSLRTDLHTSESTISEHQYQSENPSLKTKILPLPAPVLPSISTQTIPIVHFDDLPISDTDCYYLVLSICLHFWNINKWPISQKDVSDDLTNIENVFVPPNLTTQEKEHNLYYFGWVVMQTRKEIVRMADEGHSLPKQSGSSDQLNINKENVLKLLNNLGEDEEKGKLKSGAPSFEFKLKEEVLPFFRYLSACCVKLLDKNVMAIYKTNTLNNAFEKLSSCQTLRQHFLNCLIKCDTVDSESTIADKMFLLYRLVEKHMHSRQKIEIKRHNLQPKKISTATRAALKVKCSNGSNNPENTSKQKVKKTNKRKMEQSIENPSTSKQEIKAKNSATEQPECSTAQTSQCIEKTTKSSNPNKDVPHTKKNKYDFTYENVKKTPEIIIGKTMKHKWKYKKKTLFLKGEIIGFTPKETIPDDSDTEISKNEICYDLKYVKYKSKIYHYRILPDLQCGDLQILEPDSD